MNDIIKKLNSIIEKIYKEYIFITNNLIEKKEKNNCKFQQEITTSLIKLK